MNKALKGVMVFSIIFLALSAAHAQAPKSNISTVIAAGKMTGDTYTNAYFGISLTAPKAKFTAPSFVNVSSRIARLVDVTYDSPDGAKNYTLGFLANSLENYPKDMSMADYLHRARRELEKEGLVIKREEVPVVISGIHFTGVVVLVRDKPNSEYYRGIYSSFMKGYIVAFDVQCGSEDRLQQLLASAVKINPN